MKCLVDHLKGYQPTLDECKDMKVVADVLRLCDYYDIQTLIPKVMSRILNLSVNIRNVMNCYALSRSLNDIKAFQDLSRNLSSKCILFLRANLASWQVLIQFLVDNSVENKLLVEIVEELACKKIASIRYGFNILYCASCYKNLAAKWQKKVHFMFVFFKIMIY